MIKATIYFKAIHWNIRKLRKQLLPSVKICAVLKANAYSLGDVAIGREIETEVDCFAVANIKEAIRLRECGIKKPILLFGPCQDFKSAIQNSITISIHSMREIKALSKTLQKMDSVKCKIHIKINTGMNRYGLTNVWQLKNILSTAATINNLIVDGLYTHIAYETDRTSDIDLQLKKFASFRSVIRTYYPKAVIHAACSGSAGHIPAQFDMVRVGKLMYGGFDGYRTAIKIVSKICAVQNVTTGSKIGYNGTVTAAYPLVCGVVPCGYADLTHFNFGNTHFVHVESIPCKVLGKICMDSFMIDVTAIKSPLGKTVTILSDQKGLRIMDVCRNTNTIACNLLCSLNFNRTELLYKR